MKQCIGQLKFEECMTFKEKMENRGWHNCYDVEPDEPGIYQIYRRNGSKGEAYYKGNHIWQQLNNNGWDFTWWREMKGR